MNPEQRSASVSLASVRTASRTLALLLIAFCASAVSNSAAADELKRRGFLGAQFKTEGKVRTSVSSIKPESLAAKLNLQPDDVVSGINGHTITTAGIDRELRTLRAGDHIALQVQRAGCGTFEVDGILPEAPREQVQGADVIYDSVRDSRGERLRTIVTKPAGAREKLPVIFVAGWLSDDTVEAPADTRDSSGLVFRGLAALPNFATLRMDKPGVGDSEGNCAETEFETELSGYRAAFASLSRYDFIDPDRVYILGISNGGGFAPLVPTEAEARRVRGFVIVGGWVKTWFEHMLEIERRRLALSGKSPAEVNNAIKKLATFYEQYLIREKKPGDLLRDNPQLAAIWTGDGTHQDGRPAAFYQQLQKLNLEQAWSKVAVPTLALHGEFDWIMSRDDHEKIVGYVNANRPGEARFIEVPQMGHTFQHFASMETAFKGEELPFDTGVVQILTDWFQQHRGG